MNKLFKIPSQKDIIDAHLAIQRYIHKTPVFTCQAINEIAGCQLFFKCENFQKIGAFKMRGASCAVESLSEEERRKGIGTHSSGNHAQAVARAAQLNGVEAHIVMPEAAPAIKRRAVEGYGATIYTSGNLQEDRETKMNEVIAENNITFIHPYDDYNIIAGQATASKELLDEIPDLDIVLAPVGGGGLLSGTALWTKLTYLQTKVYGAEPIEVDDAYKSLHSGQLVRNTSINTIADGLRTNLSEKTFSIIQQYVDDIFTCSEERIVQALRLTWERMKIIIEPSCAVPLAAILEHPAAFQGKRVGVILSGGNVDLEAICQLFE